MSHNLYNVTIRFQFPPWDEVDGITYHGVSALRKSDAVRQVRKEAENDGHLPARGKGRVTITALQID